MINKFAFAAQWLAAGGQHMNSGRTAQQALGQSRHCIERVLAIVEYDEQRLILKIGHERGNRLIAKRGEPENGGQSARNQFGVR